MTRLLPLILLLSACAHPQADEPVQVRQAAPAIEQVQVETYWALVRVIDGDTIDVRQGETVARVRLLCVNTPERGKAGYKEARDFLLAAVTGRRLRLEADPQHADRDRFGRLLRYVWADGEMVNAAIIRAGHSEYWTKYGASSTHHADLR